MDRELLEQVKFIGDELELVVFDKREAIIQDNLTQLRDALQDIPSEGDYNRYGVDPTNEDSAYRETIKYVHCDEVYPQILIGNGVTARNRPYLKDVNVTHVLNAAECAIRTGANYYKEEKFQYLGYDIRDLVTYDINRYFEAAANFIDEALRKPESIVFVHCHMGISRSATLVIAYLMIKKNMSALEALSTVKSLRRIRPNVGFLRQLVELDLRLSKQ